MELQNIAHQINHHHEQAHGKALEAIEHAKAAGELLLRIKAALPHGTFTKWIEVNLTVSDRQAQRYIAVAKGKPMPIRQLAGKTDTRVSVFKPEVKASEGIWDGENWKPERWHTYLFNDGQSTFWVTPNPQGAFHVCKHYNGLRMATKGFYWRYTIFSTISDPDLTSEFYMGTRSPIINANGIQAVLKSYGLSDLKNSFVFGSEDRAGNERPFGEPSSENWYWDNDEPDDALFQTMKKMHFINANGAAVFN